MCELLHYAGKVESGREKIVTVGVYGPGIERSENKQNSFWEDLNECISGFNERERITVLGDMNTKVGTIETDGVIGKYNVPGVNENYEKLVKV